MPHDARRRWRKASYRLCTDRKFFRSQMLTLCKLVRYNGGVVGSIRASDAGRGNAPRKSIRLLISGSGVRLSLHPPFSESADLRGSPPLPTGSAESDAKAGRRLRATSCLPHDAGSSAVGAGGRRRPSDPPTRSGDNHPLGYTLSRSPVSRTNHRQTRGTTWALLPGGRLSTFEVRA